VALHITVVVVVTSFILLARWQVDRALSGNELSWVYAFEWPFFAGYAIYMWWKLLADDTLGSSRPARPETEREREELAAYNRYLAELADNDGPGRRGGTRAR
jgi:hypothetical protein